MVNITESSMGSYNSGNITEINGMYVAPAYNMQNVMQVNEQRKYTARDNRGNGQASMGGAGPMGGQQMGGQPMGSQGPMNGMGGQQMGGQQMGGQPMGSQGPMNGMGGQQMGGQPMGSQGAPSGFMGTIPGSGNRNQSQGAPSGFMGSIPGQPQNTQPMGGPGMQPQNTQPMGGPGMHPQGPSTNMPNQGMGAPGPQSGPMGAPGPQPGPQSGPMGAPGPQPAAQPSPMSGPMSGPMGAPGPMSGPQPGPMGAPGPMSGPQPGPQSGPMGAPGPMSGPQPAAPAAPQKHPVPQLVKTVQKGQKVSMFADGATSSMKICMGWSTLNGECDVDVSAFMLGADGKVIGDDWFVFYGQPQSPDGSTSFKMEGGQDVESVTIQLAKLNPSVKKISFVLTINDAFEKNLNFGMVADAYIRILDGANGQEFVSFKMTDYYSNVSSMMIGEVYNHNGTWKFSAVGNGLAKDLAGLCEFYGVDVSD